MRSRRSAVSCLVALACSCCAAEPAVEQVTARNEKFEVVQVLDEAAPLERFAKLWRTRREVEAGGRSRAEFRFTLDIATGEHSGRWLYSPTASRRSSRSRS